MLAATVTTVDTDLRAYYAARAAEYERVYDKPERQDDLALLARRVPALLAGRDVLEIACGTGWWTRRVGRTARSLLATDATPETLDVARSQLPDGLPVTFAQADAYALDRVPGRFDAGLANFWWSHVPRERMQDFLRGLHARLEPGSVVVMVDNRYAPGSSTPLSRTDAQGNTYQLRKLQNGDEHEVLKNFPADGELESQLATHADDVRIEQTTYYWLLHYRTRPAP